MSRVVQTLSLQKCFFGSRGHGAFLKNSAGQRSYFTAAFMPRKIIRVRIHLKNKQDFNKNNKGQIENP
jgi:hypothetical protein